MSGQLAYLDSSALLKLVVAEKESRALTGFLQDWPDRISSALSRVEVMRAVRRIHPRPRVLARAEETLEKVNLVAVDAVVISKSEIIDPPEMRSLDALHLATALSLGDDLGVMVTYDARLGGAAREMGMPIAAPGSGA